MSPSQRIVVWLGFALSVSEEEEEEGGGGGGGGGAMALARGMKTIGVPGKLLHESEGHTVTVRK